MPNNKIYFTTEEINQYIVTELANPNQEYVEEIIEDAVNVYYTYAESEADVALTQYGLEKAEADISEYEYEHHGEFFTDMADKPAVSDKLFYVKGMEYAWNNPNERIQTLIRDNEGEPLTDAVHGELINLFNEDSDSAISQHEFNGEHVHLKTLHYLQNDNVLFKTKDVHAALKHNFVEDMPEEKWLSQSDVSSMVYLDRNNEHAQQFDNWMKDMLPNKSVIDTEVTPNPISQEVER